jgi:hypothetical protein
MGCILSLLECLGKVVDALQYMYLDCKIWTAYGLSTRLFLSSNCFSRTRKLYTDLLTVPQQEQLDKELMGLNKSVHSSWASTTLPRGIFSRKYVCTAPLVPMQPVTACRSTLGLKAATIKYFFLSLGRVLMQRALPGLNDKHRRLFMILSYATELLTRVNIIMSHKHSLWMSEHLLVSAAA